MRSPGAIVPGLLGAVAIAAALPAHAGQGRDKVSLEHCLKAAKNVRDGAYVKVEYLKISPAGVPTYEIEIRDDAGTEWELMCNARTGDVYEIETEAASADDEAFAENAKISEKRARQTALDRYPGEIEEVEYEIEANGQPSYEIDIVDEGGTEFKVEVDAVSGDIIEVSVESWEIGEEPDERP